MDTVTEEYYAAPLGAATGEPLSPPAEAEEKPLSPTAGGEEAVPDVLGEQTDAAPQADAAAADQPVSATDYEALAEADLAELRRLVPSLVTVGHISQLPGAARYAELREAGLSVEEAFWAACHTYAARETSPYDNRSHLHSAVPRGAAGNPAVMSAAEMSAARELFGDLTESEIQKLYARCRA